MIEYKCSIRGSEWSCRVPGSGRGRRGTTRGGPKTQHQLSDGWGTGLEESFPNKNTLHASVLARIIILSLYNHTHIIIGAQCAWDSSNDDIFDTLGNEFAADSISISPIAKPYMAFHQHTLACTHRGTIGRRRWRRRRTCMQPRATRGNGLRYVAKVY